MDPVFRARASLLLALALAATTAGAGLYRVTCKGIHKLSTTTTVDSCAESGMLDDTEGRFLPSFSEAHADLGRGVLVATAGGGAIRDVGYDGREATSIIIEQFRLNGSWTGKMPVEITMRLRYRFEGDGESRLGVMLRSSTAKAIRGEHQAAMWMRYTGLGGAVVLAGRTRGQFEQPADGSIASRTTIELKVIQIIDAAAPDLEIRADLARLRDAQSRIVRGISDVAGASPRRDRAHRTVPVSHRSTGPRRRLGRSEHEPRSRGAGFSVLTGTGWRLDGKPRPLATSGQSPGSVVSAVLNEDSVW